MQKQLYDTSYTISDQGTIKNKHGYTLKPWIALNGYLRVRILHDKKRINIYIHMAVYDHFGEPKVGVVDHIDGDRLKCNIENLQKISQSENIRKGSLNRKKLSDKDVFIIKEALNMNHSLKKIQNYFLERGKYINVKTLSGIKNNRIYK